MSTSLKAAQCKYIPSLLLDLKKGELRMCCVIALPAGIARTIEDDQGVMSRMNLPSWLTETAPFGKSNASLSPCMSSADNWRSFAFIVLRRDFFGSCKLSVLALILRPNASVCPPTADSASQTLDVLIACRQATLMKRFAVARDSHSCHRRPSGTFRRLRVDLLPSHTAPPWLSMSGSASMPEDMHRRMHW